MLAFASPALAQNMAIDAGNASFPVLDGRITGIALFAELPFIASDYSAAMVRYRLASESRGGDEAGFPLLGHENPPLDVPWIWIAEDGSSLQRMRQDLFRISHSHGLGNWFSPVDCRIIDWPQFTCSDGEIREMSSPSLASVIFGDVEYRRVIREPVETTIDEAALTVAPAD